MGRIRTLAFALAAAATLIAGPSAAEIIERSEDHFVLRFGAPVEATLDTLNSAVADIDQWWDPAHTYSGDAANLSLSLEPGSCFCERLGNGTTFQHGRVEAHEPKTGVLLRAPLGPLNGRTTVADWTLRWEEDADSMGRDLGMTYVVRGQGIGAFADAVNGVMATQWRRLVDHVETREP